MLTPALVVSNHPNRKPFVNDQQQKDAQHSKQAELLPSVGCQGKCSECQPDVSFACSQLRMTGGQLKAFPPLKFARMNGTGIPHFGHFPFADKAWD